MNETDRGDRNDYNVDRRRDIDSIEDGIECDNDQNNDQNNDDNDDNCNNDDNNDDNNHDNDNNEEGDEEEGGSGRGESNVNIKNTKNGKVVIRVILHNGATVGKFVKLLLLSRVQ